MQIDEIYKTVSILIFKHFSEIFQTIDFRVDDFVIRVKRSV